MDMRNWRVDLRVIWAIFLKDLREAVRNRNTISVLLTALFIVVMYKMLPVLGSRDEPLQVWVYDQSGSFLSERLEMSPAVDARVGLESLDQLQTRLRNSDLPEVGLVIPEAFEAQADAGQGATLEIYIMDWIDPRTADELTQRVKDTVGGLLEQDVPLKFEVQTLSMLPESDGPGVMASLAGAVALITIGVALVPHLMMAEKQERTLEMLLVSPASEMHVMAGKALSGGVYAIVAGGIALALNHAIVVHWWLAILGLLAFSLLAIALGLLLGSFIETRGQLSLWSWVVLFPMLLPMFIVLMQELMPAGLVQVLRFAPAVAFCTVWRHAFAGPIDPLMPLLWLGYLLLWALAVLLVVLWLLRRRDRPAAARTQRAASPPGLESGPRPAGSAGDASVQMQATASPLSGASLSPAGVKVARRSTGRILWAIFAKDMREALSSRLLLSILLGTIIVILNGSAIPWLLELRWRPAAVIYSADSSQTLRTLLQQEELRAQVVDSPEAMRDIVTSRPGTWLGLEIPADFDVRAERGGAIELGGYHAHWADQRKIEETRALLEEQWSEELSVPLRIETEGHILYPDADIQGQIGISLLTVMIAMTTIGASLVPLLMVEEKEAHTLEALVISPAGYREVILGKGLVGAVYCLLALGVAMLFNGRYVVHADVLALAAVLNVAFVVALGMFIGMLADNPASAAMWATPMLLLVFVPSIAAYLGGSLLPVWLSDALTWTPGPLMLQLLALSTAGRAPPEILGYRALALAAMAGALYLSVWWSIRRLDR